MPQRILRLITAFLVTQTMLLAQVEEELVDAELSLPPVPAPVIKPSIGTCQQPDFFVIDSSTCPQKPRRGYPRCTGSISRYLPDNRYHHSCESELLASIEPGVPICIVVHGSFVGAGSLYHETVGRYRRLISSSGDRPLHFIACHWPSQLAVPVMLAAQGRCLGRKAEFNGIYLAQFISKLPPDNPVCIIGHSHGCRVISSAVHLLGGGTVDGFAVRDACPQRRIRVVFGAGAIDQHWLNPGEKYGCGLNRVECLLNIMNPKDIVLKLYPLQYPHLDQAAGRLGFRQCDLCRMGGNAAKIRQINVSNMVGHGHVIAHYAPWPQIRAAYLPYVYFD